jgi:cell division protein FtsW
MSRPNAKTPDRVLLLAVLSLLLLGMAVIFSASSYWSADRHADFAVYLKRHCIRVMVSLALFALLSKIDYRRYREWTPYFVMALFVMLVAVYFYPKANDVNRTIPLWGQRFQPAEAMKLMTVFFMAAVLAKGPPPDTGPFWGSTLSYYYMYLIGSVLLVFFEPDMGTAIVVFCVGMAMFFLGGVRFARLAQMTALMLPLVAAGMAVKPYQWHRLKVFISGFRGSGSLPYQVEHSLIALSRGGLTGVGFGEGHEKNLYLPQPFSDFILATLGEELGFIGIAVLLVLLFVILWRGYQTAFHARDHYGFLLAGGITSMVMINALINAGVVMNLLPTSGLPFPFISYGGSALFTVMAGMGVLLNISKNTTASFRELPLEGNRI